MRSLARGFSIPRRLEEDDILQELRVVLWKLTKRVDPHTCPDDFRRLIKTEMKNRCVDLTRFFKAQKRTTRLGRAMQCSACNTMTPWSRGDVPVCSTCGAVGEVGKNTSKIRWVDRFASDVSIGPSSGSDDDGGGSETDNPHAISVDLFPDPRQIQPNELLSDKEIIKRIREVLPVFPESKLFDIYVDTPEDFIAFMLENDYPPTPKRAPYWLLAKYLGGVSEKMLRMAHTKIALVAAQIAGRKEMIQFLPRYNLGQIGYQGV